jgi:NADH:ubiquinone oxidoreductase subunit 5 (subunit L)/multisubunit Na+/H+ antiporter MnhA subunit
VLWGIGWLAISGVPPFSGFWSKDEILAVAWQENPFVWGVGILTALLTAFYMSRATFLTFGGPERFRGAESDAGELHLGDAEVDPDAELATADSAAVEAGAHDEDDHVLEPHESPWIMVVPMAVLSVFAIGIGLLNLPFTDSSKRLELWLEPVLSDHEVHLHISGGEQLVLALCALVLVVFGMLVARWVYLEHPDRAARFEPALFANAWYVDRGISGLVSGPGRSFFDAVAWFDRTIVDGAVNGAAVVVRGAAVGLRKTQTGFVRSYALAVAIGAVVLVGWLLTRAGW